MFYQEALPKFRSLSRVDNLPTFGDRHWRKVSTTFEKAESANSLPFAQNGCLFMWDAYFCMGAYKRDVDVVIKMGAYIHGCLFCVEAYYPDFTVPLPFPLLKICACSLTLSIWR